MARDMARRKPYPKARRAEVSEKDMAYSHTLPVVIVLPQMVQEGGEGLLCLVIFQIAFKCQTVAFYLKIV